MRRRLIIVLVILVALIAFTLVALAFIAVRGNRQAPGTAAPAGVQEHVASGIERLDLRFPCGSSMCAGWLYLPETEEPAVVVMAHGFAGTRDVTLPAFAERFAREGIAAFVFDYRHFGDSGGLPRQLVDPWQQLDDWRAAIAFVRTRTDVDSGRLALWGSSMGAGHALTIAAEEPKLRALVAQAPLIDTSIRGEATIYGTAWAARLMLTAWGDLAGSAFGYEPVLIPAIARSGEFGMIIDDAAYASFQKLVGPTSTYRNAVVARSIFTFDDYNPAAHTSAINTPTLLIASREDRFAPFAAVQAYADRSRKVTVKTFDGDHFDIYSPPTMERAGNLAAVFLDVHLRTK